MTEEELKDMLKARDMLDAQSVPELSPERLHNIMEAMGVAPRPWAGLTEEELFEIMDKANTRYQAVQMTETILKKRNT